MADFHEATFKWPRTDASDVICTGTFDQWSSSIHLDRVASGFEAKIKVPWSDKILYKFVVDGRWTTAYDQPTEYDPAGNLNNIYRSPSKPAPVLAPEAVAPEPKLTNGEVKRESRSIVEKVTEMGGNVAEMANNAAAPALEFASKFVDEPNTPTTSSEPKVEPTAPSELKPLPSPPSEASASPAEPELLPKVQIPVVPITEQAASPTEAPSESTNAPSIPAAPAIPPPEPLETVIVPGAAVDNEKKDEAAKDEVQPSTHTGGVADVIAASPAQLTEPSPTPSAELAKVNGNGVAKTPEHSQSSTPAASPSKSISPRDRHFSFPSIRRSSSQNIPRSSSPTPSGSPTGTTKFKTGERQKRNSIFGKLKEVFHHEKDKSGEKTDN